MINTLIVIQIVLLIWILIEIIILHKCRTAFDELLMKFIELSQGLYERMETSNKKLSENVSSLTKTLQSALTIKNDAKVLEGAVKDLQGISKYIKVGALKEFKDVEDGIKKLKYTLKQGK